MLKARFLKSLVALIVLGLLIVLAGSASSQDPPNIVTVEAESTWVNQSGNWQLRTAATASNESCLYSQGGTQNDVLTVRFTGAYVSLSYVTDSGMGVMAIEIDGQVRRTVDTSASELSYRRVTIDYLEPETHVLRVYPVEGTIAIDAFHANIVVPEDDDSEEQTTSKAPLKVVVKFQEGSGVRLREGTLVGTPAADISPVHTILENWFAIHEVKRLFSLSEDVLAEQRLEAEMMSQRTMPDLNLYYAFYLDARTSTNEVNALLEELNALPVVQTAYYEPPALPAGGIDISPVTPLYVDQQGYLDPAPVGVNARFGWSYPGGDGAGVRVVDVEGGWQVTHEDLPLSEASLLTEDNSTSSAWRNHGTAVLGEISGIDNEYGITGISPGAEFKLVSIFEGWSYDTANAISIATANTQPGDVILIEVHRKGPGPHPDDPDPIECTCNCGQFEYIAIEYLQADFDAILIATSSGRTVVEAAGNGSMDLDDMRYEGAFDRNVRDSGAILVAGSTSDGHTPMCWTNYGSRIDVHAWGENVVTTGYGDLFNPGGDKDQQYTATFNGTSSASPIVVGTATIIQGVARESGMILRPTEVRQLLVNTGTPQDASDPRHIGPMPDVEAALSDMFPRHNLMLDGSFEEGSPNPYWSEISDNFSSLIFENGTVAYDGSHYAWLGGASGINEISTVEQSLIIPEGNHTVLRFYMYHNSATPGDGDFFEVRIDGDVVFSLNNGDSGYDAWTQVFADLGAYNDGNQHTVTFYATDNQGGNTNWFVDSVALLHDDSAVSDTLALINPAFNYISLVDTLQNWPAWPDRYDVFVAGTGILGQWVMGDWDGDKQKTPAVFTNGALFFTNEVGTAPPDEWDSVWLGPTEGYPIAGRFSEAPNDCIGLVVDDIGLWWTCDFSIVTPKMEGQWLGGQLGDKTGDYQFTAGDWDGDGIDTVAIRRDEYITWTNVHPDTVMALFNNAQYIGQPSDLDYGLLVSGDWDNNTLDSFGLFYQPNGMFFYRNDLEWNSGVHILQYVGEPILTPVTATSWRKR